MSEKKKNPGGVPSTYTKEMGDKICELVATNACGINKIVEMNPELPTPITIHQWRLKYKEFAYNYAEAKRKQADLLAEDILNIADETINYTYVDENGKVKRDAAAAQANRLRVDTRKWLASKLLPKIYGSVEIDNLRLDNSKLQEEIARLRAELNEQNKRDY